MFPEFKIGAVDEQTKSAIGTLSRTDQGSEHWIDHEYLGCLLHGRELAFGRWHQRGDQWQFQFKEEEWGKLSLAPGLTVFALCSYWGERVELAYDKSIEWQRMTFVDTGRTDHLHCEICWATISEHENPLYYSGGRNRAVCLECYTESVGPGNLNFVPAHNNSLQARRP